MTSPKRVPLPAITGIRVLLALWVVALHIDTINLTFAHLVDRAPVTLQDAIHSGASAVGIFFLLSGFVLAYNYDLSRPWRSLQRSRFWIARIARIYPVYAFALLLAIPSLIAGTVKAGPIHPASILVGMASVILLLQAWIPQDALFWGGPAWSLSVEVFFYLTFPFLGCLLWKIEQRRFQILTLAALWLSACILSYTLALWKAPWFLGHTSALETSWTEIIKFNPLVRLPEFLAGIILCKLYLSLQQRPTSLLPPGGGALLYLRGFAIAIAVITQERHLPPAVLHDGLLMPATAAVILGLSFGGGPIWRLLSHPTVVLLGQASYAMYLLHMPLYSYFGASGKRLVHTPTEGWILLLLYLIALIGLSCATFLKLEEPSRKVILARLSPARPSARETA
jgi:peptidoglycan/LPS O-acetylase OafA/YrhL